MDNLVWKKERCLPELILNKKNLQGNAQYMYEAINIVIPVYNEGENIGQMFSEIENKINLPFHIYIVFDFESDNTIPVVRKFMEKRKNIHLIKNKYGSGALNAVKTGFEAVDKGVILVVMADLHDELGRVGEMLSKINEGDDIVCGSRYMRGGKQIGGPWFKKLLSRFAGTSLHYLVGIPTHDITNSFKMYSKTVLKNIKIESNGGFELGMEIVIKAFFKGYKISEVPQVTHDRKWGESRFKLVKWLPNYIHWYWFAIQKKIELTLFQRNTV